MDYFKGTKTQISPCIAAKVRYALSLNRNKPSNTKKCSYAYWLKVIETFSHRYDVAANVTEEAKKKYKSLIK
jgi:hypothetical protein